MLSAPSEFLAKDKLPRVLRQSRLSAHDMGDNEMMPGAVHRSCCIYITAEENSENPLLGDRQSNGVSNVQMRSVGSHRKSGKKELGKKKRTG